jgi:hypothetical protein
VKRALLSGFALCLVSTGQVVSAANCPEPAAFTDEIPHGASATRETMLSTQRSMKAYENSIKAFADCLRDAGDTSHRADAAILKFQQLASRFNDELKVFKEKNGAG